MRIDDVWEMAVTVLLAALGGMARLLNLKDTKALQISRMAGELFVAAFVGGMIYLLANYMNIESSYLMWLVAGISGWLGPKALDRIVPLLGKLNMDTKTNSDIENDKKEGERNDN